MGAQTVETFDIGRGFVLQNKRLWGVQRGSIVDLAVSQAMQQIEHMCLDRHAYFEGHRYRGQDRLHFIVEYECQDVTMSRSPRFAQHVILQLSECLWQFGERCAIAQCPWLALNDNQIVSPVTDSARR
jgi:hypothetical protein